MALDNFKGRCTLAGYQQWAVPDCSFDTRPDGSKEMR